MIPFNKDDEIASKCSATNVAEHLLAISCTEKLDLRYCFSRF